jgi:hypothetical protein
LILLSSTISKFLLGAFIALEVPMTDLKKKKNHEPVTVPAQCITHIYTSWEVWPLEITEQQLNRICTQILWEGAEETFPSCLVRRSSGYCPEVTCPALVGVS